MTVLSPISAKDFSHRIVSELISTGKPVSIARAADLLGDTSVDHHITREVLNAWQAPERDESGAIIACGVSLSPTAISFTIGGRQLYTRCSLDTLVFPRWADTYPAKVRTDSDSLPGEAPVPVSWEVTPSGVMSQSHEDIHIIALTTYGSDAVRCCFCNHIRTFVSKEAAQLAQRDMEKHAPGSTVLWSLEEAWQKCEPLIDSVVKLPETFRNDEYSTEFSIDNLMTVQM